MAGENIHFTTYDGVKLVGTLYSAGEKRPCVIMTQGVSILTDKHISFMFHPYTIHFFAFAPGLFDYLFFSSPDSKSTSFPTSQRASTAQATQFSSTTTATGAKVLAPRATKSTQCCKRATTTTRSITRRACPPWTRPRSSTGAAACPAGTRWSRPR